MLDEAFALHPAPGEELKRFCRKSWMSLSLTVKNARHKEELSVTVIGPAA